MKKNVLICVISSLIFFISAGYFGLLYGIPAYVNSKHFSHKLENYINQKTNLYSHINNLKIKISPTLVTLISCSEISLSENNDKIIDIKGIDTKIDLKNIALREINTEEIFVDFEHTQEILAKLKTQDQSKPFDFGKLPDITAKKIDLLLNKQNQQLELKNLLVKSTENNIKTINFTTTYEFPQLTKAVTLGQNGNLFVKNNELYANNFSLISKDISINLNGKLYGKKGENNFIVNAQNIPIEQTVSTILYYQKLHDKNKKFIENFKNYNGKIDLKISVENNQIKGLFLAKNLSATSNLFNVPIVFPNAKFYLENGVLTSIAQGTLGGEKVTHTLVIENVTSKNRKTVGTVKSTLTENQIKKYLPDIYTLKNSADAKVIYTIKDNIPEVEYFLNLKEGSDLIYKNAYLGLKDKTRQLSAKTIKTSNGLKLKKYKYSILSETGETPIILGEGNFIKQNNKLTPEYITCETEGYAPTYVTGSFGQYVDGGEFKGKLKYDFIKDKLLGNFELVNTVFNKFFIKSATVSANLKGVDISAEGKYNNQHFDCKLNAQNRMDGIFIVHDMTLFMDKFILKRKRRSPSEDFSAEHKHKQLHKNFDKVSSKIRKIDMTIEKWNILVKEFHVDNIKIDNLKLFGSLKDSSFNFELSDIFFANGLLSAKGQYNFNNNSSDIDFYAKNIDADDVATILFKLPKQIQGIANAKLHVETFKNFQELYAKGSFKIKDGFLPQLGNTEFMLGRTGKKRKIKMYNLTNIDFSQIETLSSDIEGSFELQNYDLKNIEITTQQSFMSLYITGDYNILDQKAIANIYGRYDIDAPKGIKILFVPLNLILKLALRPEDTRQIYQKYLDKIPPVKSKRNRLQYFRVNVNGNLNSDDIDVTLKRIK